MKLMELLVEEQQHMIVECYTLNSIDAARLSIIQESYVNSVEQYRQAVVEYSENSRQYHVAKEKMDRYTTLYHDFVTEMDQHYGNKK